MIKRKSIQRKLRPVPKNCPFCQKKTQPDYKDYDLLKNFLTERGKIVGKDRSGICSRHQRQLSNEIKRARILSLLPFTVRVR